MELAEEWPECVDQMGRSGQRVVKLVVGVDLPAGALASLATTGQLPETRSVEAALCGAAVPVQPAADAAAVATAVEDAATNEPRDPESSRDCKATRHARTERREAERARKAARKEEKRANGARRSTRLDMPLKSSVFRRAFIALYVDNPQAPRSLPERYAQLAADMGGAVVESQRGCKVSVFTVDTDTVAEELFDQGIRAMDSPATLPRAEELFKVLTKVVPRHALGWYNRACVAALMGRGGALGCLQYALDTGYTKTEHALADEDLASLRDNPKFLEIVAKMRDAATQDVPPVPRAAQERYVVRVELKAHKISVKVASKAKRSWAVAAAASGEEKAVEGVSAAAVAGDEAADDVSSNADSDSADGEEGVDTTALDLTEATGTCDETTGMDVTLVETEVDAASETEDVDAAARVEAKWAAEIQILSDMGFSDRARSEALLDRHTGDLQAVVSEMIA